MYGDEAAAADPEADDADVEENCCCCWCWELVLASCIVQMAVDDCPDGGGSVFIAYAGLAAWFGWTAEAERKCEIFASNDNRERENIYIYYLLLSSSILSIRHSRDVDNPSALLFSNTIAIFLMLIGLTEIGFPIDIHLRMKLPPPHNKPRDSPGRKKVPIYSVCALNLRTSDDDESLARALCQTLLYSNV